MTSWFKNRLLKPVGRFGRSLKNRLTNLWHRAWWSKALLIVIVTLLLVIASMVGVAKWYAHSTKNKPFTLGVTFVPDYARSLGLNAEEAMDALINDLGVQRFRLVSYWNKVEHTEGSYNFSDLDWQFEKAEAADAKVSLAVGLRQPRWPECHTPDWAKDVPIEQLQPQLNNYIAAVVDRYKNSPSLESYQLENEYFNDFGICPDHTRKRLVEEYDLIKELDPDHPIIVSKSNNFPGGAFGAPRPDIVGVSVYRRVWDAKVTKSYFDYPLPAWYYGFNAGLQKIFTGKDSVIHELQMEPWPPEGKFITNVSLEEQDKSMNASMFADRMEFARHTGIRYADLWGAEWWYWRMVKHNDPGVWNEAKEAFNKYN